MAKSSKEDVPAVVPESFQDTLPESRQMTGAVSLDVPQYSQTYDGQNSRCSLSPDNAFSPRTQGSGEGSESQTPSLPEAVEGQDVCCSAVSPQGDAKEGHQRRRPRNKFSVLADSFKKQPGYR